MAQVLIEDTAGGHAVPVDEYLPLLAEEEPITASEPPASILGDDELILGEEAGAGHGELACSFHLTKAILGAGKRLATSPASQTCGLVPPPPQRQPHQPEQPAADLGN